MIKNDLRIPSHRKRVSLLLRQQHMYCIIFRFVFSISAKMKDFLNVHAFTLIDVEGGDTAAR